MSVDAEIRTYSELLDMCWKHISTVFGNENIRVKGTIELYKNKPQLIIENPDAIVVL
jgi:DNA/RNA endonuclease YhcR with UshA esterase domain